MEINFILGFIYTCIIIQRLCFVEYIQLLEKNILSNIESISNSVKFGSRFIILHFMDLFILCVAYEELVVLL